MFHGVNSVYKGFPWYFAYLLNDTRLDDLERFGMNVVRLGTMWSGVEPEEGVYNQTYIDILQNIIQVSE
jgi:endoglycosylceramidase